MPCFNSSRGPRLRAPWCRTVASSAAEQGKLPGRSRGRLLRQGSQASGLGREDLGAPASGARLPSAQPQGPGACALQSVEVSGAPKLIHKMPPKATAAPSAAPGQDLGGSRSQARVQLGSWGAPTGPQLPETTAKPPVMIGPLRHLSAHQMQKGCRQCPATNHRREEAGAPPDGCG